MEFNFVKNSKGNDSLFINKFKFRFHSKKVNKLGDEIVRWRCDVKGCSATASTVDRDLRTGIDSKHNHGFIVNQMTIQQFKSDVKNLVLESPTKSFHLQLIDVQKKVKDDKVILPSLKSIKSSLYRVKSKVIPNMPDSFDKLIFSPDFTLSLNNEKFLQKKDDVNRFLVYFTDDFFEKVTNSKDLYFDGTFKYCPKLFHQMYTIHFEVEGEYYPGI